MVFFYFTIDSCCIENSILIGYVSGVFECEIFRYVDSLIGGYFEFVDLVVSQYKPVFFGFDNFLYDGGEDGDACGVDGGWLYFA